MAVVYSENDIKVKVYGSKNTVTVHLGDESIVYIAKGNHMDPNTIRIGYVPPNNDIKYHFIISKKYGLKLTHIDYCIGPCNDSKSKYVLISEIVPSHQVRDLVHTAEALRNVAITVRNSFRENRHRNPPSKYAILPLVDDLRQKLDDIIGKINSSLESMKEAYENLDERVAQSIFGSK